MVFLMRTSACVVPWPLDVRPVLKLRWQAREPEQPGRKMAERVTICHFAGSDLFPEIWWLDPRDGHRTVLPREDQFHSLIEAFDFAVDHGYEVVPFRGLVDDGLNTDTEAASEVTAK